MSDTIKVTEMTQSTSINDNDLIMIVQNGANKKVTKKTLLSDLDNKKADKEEVQKLSQQVSTNKTDISNIKTDLTNAKKDIADNKTDIETLQAKNEALEAECEALRNDLNNSTLTVSGTGENVTLEGTAEARFKTLEVGGNSKQDEEPSPKNPQEVKTIKGNANVVICNKNWLEISCNNQNFSGISLENNGNYVTLKGTSTGKSGNLTLLKSNTYVKVEDLPTEVSFSVKDYLPKGVELAMAYGDENGYWISNIAILNNNTKSVNRTLTPPSNAKYIRCNFTINDNIVLDNVDIYPMIEEGLTVTNYIEHQHQNFILPLGNMELCKIGDYKDYIYKKDSKWYKHNEIGKVVLNGTERYNYQNNNRFFMQPTNWNKNTQPRKFETAQKQGIYCDRFIEVTADQTWAGVQGVSYDAQGGTINISCKTVATSEEDFKNWLATNNTTIYYLLNNPYDEEITDTSLIAVLDQIEKTAHSYGDKTHIYSTDELSPIFDVQAVGDLNAVISSLKN